MRAEERIARPFALLLIRLGAGKGRGVGGMALPDSACSLQAQNRLILTKPPGPDL